MPDSFDYTTGTNSENVRLLQALIDDAPEYTEETNSRNANILKSIINNTEYTDAPQSEIEELLLRLKAKIGGEIEVDELNVTENGTYDAGVNKAYNPVTVELPLDSKTITENGTYTASDDNLAGYDEVTVAVEGYAKKSIANTPTDIATFNASALPMPSLKVGIEAVQSGNGDPSPTNVRPISGWSAVNVYRTGINIWDEDWEVGIYNSSSDTVIKVVDTTHIRSKNPIRVDEGITYYFNSASYNVHLIVADESGNVLYRTTSLNNGTFTVPTNGKYVYFNMALAYGTTYNNDISINYPSTDTEYHAYNGQTYTTQLKDGQGNPLTCYGGELVNVNGVQSLTNSYAKIASLKDLKWFLFNGVFYASPPTAKINFNGLCSAYKRVQKYYSELEDGEWTSMGGNGESIWIKDINYKTANDFRNSLDGVELVYELATPQTIPQDNLAIATQDGTNNLWADSGDVIEGSYFKEL